LSLEKLPALESFEPLARCNDLVAFGAWEAGPPIDDSIPCTASRFRIS
jgi:hypothetical protein